MNLYVYEYIYIYICAHRNTIADQDLANLAMRIYISIDKYTSTYIFICAYTYKYYARPKAQRDVAVSLCT